jgi:hypothetical protein
MSASDRRFKPRISAESFWADTTTIPETGCWFYLPALDGNEYGHALVHGAPKESTAHRVAFVLAFGPVPYGLHVLHRCDVKGCINPGHLYAGTAKQNKADFYSRAYPRLKAAKRDLLPPRAA